MRLSLSGNNLAASEAEPFFGDDVDHLFEKLPRLEPPGDIMKQILARLKKQGVLRQPLQNGQEPDSYPQEKQQEAAE